MSIKYLVSGQEVSFIEKLPSGKFLVQDIVICSDFEDESPHTDFGGYRVVDEVFDSAPIIKYDSQIQEKKEAISGFNKKISTLRNDINLLQDEYNKALENNKTFKEFISLCSMRTSHIVINGYDSYEIESFADATKDSREMKLITLFGRSNGDFQWNMNEYSDGSGRNYEIFPFDSYDAALNFVRDSILEKLEKLFLKHESEGTENISLYTLKSLFESANKCNVKLDGKYMDLYKKIQKSAYIADKENIEAQLKQIQMSIESLGV